MAFAMINDYSQAQKKASSFNVAFPDDPEIRRLRTASSLLHGLSGDGTDDSLIGQVREFHGQLESCRVAHEYEEFPEAHTWEYRDLHVREALASHEHDLNLERKGEG